MLGMWDVMLQSLPNMLWRDIEGIAISSTKEIVGQLYVKNVIIPLSMHENFLWRDIEGIATSSTKEIVGQLIVNVAQCILVEIKPKCVFLPNSRFIAEANVNAVKRTISHFQMHQAMKLYPREISCASDYDPLDLFSGSIGKIKKAIKELFTTPLNNFHIFLNGSLISEGLAGTIDSTRSIVGGEHSRVSSEQTTAFV
ncbi:hypothetical protein GIB67_010288 [Kingdonia uniflora]|uniref:Inositol-pentakisphosphate 2-kinase n=1 Tax=Kingdonia uniflora TaxID=39325 RepID=A0A7J7M9U2_9MAGN|nr:hypothetical protein GIB67_010288 [Kingdonia uniflora]